MSCRTTSAGSAFTSYSRIANGNVISDVATLSIFHSLRSSYQGRDAETRRTYTREEYDSLLTRQEERVSRLSELSDARRESILTRIRAARAEDMPDQGTLYALFNLNPTVRTRGNGLISFLREMARELRLPDGEVRTKFDAYVNSVDRGRSSSAPETYTEANIAEARRRDLALEIGTVHGMAKLIEEVQNGRLELVRTSVQRIDRSVLENPIISSLDSDARVLSHGYDPRSGRLEIELQIGDAEPIIKSYRDVPAEEIPSDPQELIAYWEQNVVSNPARHYSSEFEARLDAAAPRCSLCGQFANAVHTCPITGELVTMGVYDGRRTRQYVSMLGTGYDGSEQLIQYNVSIPGALRLRAEYNANKSIKIGISEWIGLYDENGVYLNGRVNGSIIVYKDEDGAMAMNTGLLTCSCSTYMNTGTCPHQSVVAQAVRTRITPPARVARAQLTEEERAALAATMQAQLEAAMVNDWTRREEGLNEARKTWRATEEVQYSENFESFVEVYNSAVTAKKANGNNPVLPYERENVLGDWAKRGSGQAFGMEIEYEFPKTMDWNAKAAANRIIGEELFAAGLSSTSSQLGYGASRRNGFQDTHKRSDGTSTWSWERDGSVNGGELVTPAMYDEPETWENLEKAVEILTRNGAVASRKAGAHIHVGTAMYNGDPKKYAELARLMTQHEDVLIRLASDPKRGTHRNNGYSSVLPDVPIDGFQDVQQIKSWQRTRSSVLNFTALSAQAPGTDHPEFRLFDSTLNVGAMQAQVKLSVAMTHAAARISDDVVGTKRKKEPLGSHSKRLKAMGKKILKGEELKDDSSTLRSLLDTLFDKKKDKDHLVAIFAQTRWSPGR
jgi:hypothetical protein